MNTIKKEIIVKNANTYLKGNDYDFCLRVWDTDMQTYIKRLDAIGFRDLGKVLDAGFGLAQWSYALSTMNKEVVGIEFDKSRFDFSTELFSDLNITSVEFFHGSVEDLPFENDSIGGVFSYSVILCTDYRKSLREFYRVMKPGAKLYFNTNGFGWYLYNLLQEHNSSSSFSSKQMAINAFDNTLKYFTTSVNVPGQCVIMPKEIVIDDLKKIGFKNIQCSGEGTLNIRNVKDIKPFFRSEYEGFEGVTEYLCTK